MGIEPKHKTYAPDKHENEAIRLEYIKSLNILDTPPEKRFDMITTLVSKLTRCEIATVTLVDDERQWFKSSCGLDVTETSRDVSFCGHTILEEKRLIINNALEDERFKNNPLVTGKPYIRSYAGIVLYGPARLPIGSLCAISSKPKEWTDEEIEILEILAKFVEKQLSSRSSDESLKRSIIIDSNMDSSLGCMDASGFRKIIDLELNKKKVDFKQGSIFTFKLIETKTLHSDEKFDSINKILIQCLDRINKEDENNHQFIVARVKSSQLSLLFFDSEFDVVKTFIEKIVEHFKKNFYLNDERKIVKFRYCCIRDINNFDDVNALNFVTDLLMLKDHKPEEIAYYEDDVELAKVRHKHKIRRKLISNIDNKQNLTMHYQPKVCLSNSYSVVGYEALLRWHDVELGGFVSPLDIFEILDAEDMTISISKLIIDRVLSDMKNWQKEGMKLKPVSINLPSDTIKMPDFNSYVINKLKEYQIEGKYIEFEILESALISDIEIIASNMRLLSESDIKFAMDDFGTGYSALHLLSTLPINTLKVDKSFVDNLLGKRNQTAIVKSIIDIGHDCGFTIVAEGVESYEQYIVLQAFGCDQIQGYYFSKPITPDRVPTFSLERLELFG